MICENIQKYTKIQASVQHGLYLFTCEIHSFNSISHSIQLEPLALEMAARPLHRQISELECPTGKLLCRAPEYIVKRWKLRQLL